MQTTDDGDLVYDVRTDIHPDFGNAVDHTVPSLVHRLVVLALADMADGDFDPASPGQVEIAKLRLATNNLRRAQVGVTLNGVPIPSGRFFESLSASVLAQGQAYGQRVIMEVTGIDRLREVLDEAVTELHDFIDDIVTEDQETIARNTKLREDAP